MEKKVKEKKNRRPDRKTMLIIYAYLLLFLLVISVTATYTWFSLSRTPQVSNLSMYVTSKSGLELALSPDTDEWGSKLSYPEMTSESFPLRPITWSEKDQRFYAANYGIDGRVTGQWEPLSDEFNANRDSRDSYYSIGTMYARTSEDVTVSLTESPQMEEGISGSGTYLIGMPIWDADKLSHTNAGQGAENAVRIGIQVTLLDESNKPLEQTKKFYIYEPNCDLHADGTTGYTQTPSIDGSSLLVPSEKLILQKTSSWTETSPVENGVQVYSIGKFDTQTELFSLKANQKAMIKLYLWLEGQDADCTNAIKEAQIIANIQFKAQPENHSGLQPIR